MQMFSRAYVAGFLHGTRQCFANLSEIAGTVVIYAVLLILFHAIYDVMPVEELNWPGLSRDKMLWYFALTEATAVALRGRERALGQVIAEGGLTVMMQRPLSMMGLFLSQMMGVFVPMLFILLGFAVLLLSGVWGMDVPLTLVQIPILLLSMFLGSMIWLLLGYAVGTSEIFGAYSQPLGWVLNKFVFTLGGLFFPVCFFPSVLETIVMLTPFPAVIYMPARIVLGFDMGDLMLGLLQQLGWVAIALLITKWAEKGMMRHVMQHGD